MCKLGRGVQVQVTHMGAQARVYKVKGITREGASRLMFMNEQEDREMSVQEYFEGRYSMK